MMQSVGGSVRGSVGDQLTGGQWFVETHVSNYFNREEFQHDQYYILDRWMSPFKDWLNLFAVSVSATVSAAIFEKFL